MEERTTLTRSWWDGSSRTHPGKQCGEFLKCSQWHDSVIFFSTACDLTLPENLARFPVLAWLRSGSWIQLGSCCPPPHTHPCTSYITFCIYSMMVLIMIHRCCSWIGQFNYFPPLAACIIFVAGMKARWQERCFCVTASYSHPQHVCVCRHQQ